MSETSKGLDASAETSTGPDLFGYYLRGIKDLLFQVDDFLPFSSKAAEVVGAASVSTGNMVVAEHRQTCKENKGPIGYDSLFCNAAGAELSSFKKERLKAMLQQCVGSVTREVDEMLDPVIGMLRLRNVMALTNVTNNHDDESGSRAKKKRKISSSSSSISIPLDKSPVSCSKTREGFPNECKGVVIPGNSISSCCKRECLNFHESDKSKQNADPNVPKSFCAACLKQVNGPSSNKDLNDSFSLSHMRDDKENGEVDDDLQILLDNRGPKVEEKMEKYSAELSSTLDRMEVKLEELLDVVISSCRPMTHAEKLELRRLIQKLPSKNLDRVVEIIHRKKPLPPEKQSSKEIHIDLQHEDHVTLWRLYFYVAAVQNARKLSG